MLKLKLTIAAAALLFSSVGNAASSFAGTITWMEVWRNGNVAFRQYIVVDYLYVVAD